MMPCSASKIHRWNALDDLDDGISDAVNDDLISSTSDFDFDDPDIEPPPTDSSMSSASSVEDSDCNTPERNLSSTARTSRTIDEDGIILALDDRTNKNNRIQDMQRLPTSKNTTSSLSIRVKKSVKYAHLSNTTVGEENQHATRLQKEPTVATIKTDGSIAIAKATDVTHHSWKPDEIDRIPVDIAKAENNVLTLRVKKSAKYGHLDHKTDAHSHKSIVSVDENSNVEIVAQPKVATISRDGSYSLSEINNNNTAIITHNGIEIAPIEPTVARIASDGSISYSNPQLLGMVPFQDGEKLEKPLPQIATIKNDGHDSTDMVATGIEQQSDWCPHQDCKDDIDEELEQDDDICDNLDNSRYTRSLHSMPVLEEVTEEESPLHSIGTKSEPEGKYQETEATWIELRSSPSQTAMMTPRRTNDEQHGSTRTKSMIPPWLKFSPMSSFRSARYHSMGHNGDTPSPKANIGTFFSDESKSSDTNHKPLLHVETVSTTSQSENGDNSASKDKAIDRDIETGGKEMHPDGRSCSDFQLCKRNCRKRDFIAAIVIVLLGIIVGVSTFLIMNKVYDEKGNHYLEEQRTEEWLTEASSRLPPNNYDVEQTNKPSVVEGTSNDPHEDDVLALPQISDLLENNFKDEANSFDFKNGFPSSHPQSSTIVSLAPTSSPDSLNSFNPGTPVPTPGPTVTLTGDPTANPTGNPTGVPTGIPTANPTTEPTSSPVVVATRSPTLLPTVSTERPVEKINMIQAIEDTEAISSVLKRARRKIEVMIFDDLDLIGKFLRLVFHDCIGGCDGCIDMSNPENVGLDKPIDALQPVVDEFEGLGLSRTDIWMLSSLVASELALPFENNDLQFPMHWIGRQTCESRFENVTDPVTGHCGVDFDGGPAECSSKRGPHVHQPHGTMGTKSMLEFFQDEFGFTPQQITAIMGAHSVGKMARENVGFKGEWDLSVSTLDGGYWLELVGNPPDFFVETIDNTDLPKIPNRHQWRGIIKNMSRRTVAMLNVDVALVRNIEDMDSNGNVGCAGPGILLKDCPSDTPFLPFATEYNTDLRKFLMDFRDVLNLMIDHGHEKPAPNTLCPEGRICTFGGHKGPDVVDLAVEDLSPPPSPSPSRAPPKTFPTVREGHPKVSLNRLCYDKVGDILVVTYDFIPGTDITIQIFHLDDVDAMDESENVNVDFSINPNAINNPLESSLSCGRESCHTWTSKGGLQMQTDRLDGGGNDYAVVLFARTDNSDAELQILAADSFRLEGCHM